MKISAELINAEEAQIMYQTGESWVNNLKDAIYHAEDVLDDIATEASLPKETITLKWPGSSRVNLKSNLSKVTKRLEYLVSRTPNLHLRQITRETTTSLTGIQKVYGRHAEKKTIMDFLMADNEDNSKTSVVAIVGTGGVGKTTLAQLLYNEQGFEKPFTKKAWIHVSEKADVISLTKTVYELVTETPCALTDLDKLQDSLRNWLEENTVLLVLDDVCSETFKGWELLFKPFEYAAKGSWIIVTTRSHHVVEMVCASYTHTLLPLSDEDCRLLFMDHLHGPQHNDVLDREFANLTDQIVNKCQGLPLAAKAFGGLLRYTNNVDGWKEILNSKIWTTSPTKILDVLRVSYHYLPPHLKRCFAYCSIFPKRYAFDMESVVLLWMAEGLLQKEKNKETMEHGYFSELVSRSLFQQSGAKFIMHDLINELAQFAAGEFCFKYENQIIEKPGKIRHLSYLREQYSGEAKKFDVLQKEICLRTFLPLSLKDSSQTCFLNKMVSDKLLPNLTCLRVLSLSHYNIATLPKDIFKRMRHVRYLDLSWTSLVRLPESVGSLYNLQTLLLSYCSKLIELEGTICDLIRLEHLDLTGATRLKQMPKKFGRLKTLQTLTTFVVSTGKGANISALRDLIELRGKLTILELDNVGLIREAKEANLEGKTLLKEIEYVWGTHARNTNSTSGMQNEEAIFENLRPHKQIEELTITRYYGNSFPVWMSDSSFSSIVCLSLTECQRCTSLPYLGRLAGLKELHISKMEQLRSIGSEFYTSHPESRDQEQQPFRSLQVLSLVDMPNWENWIDVKVFGDSLFPNLEELTMIRCPELTSDLPGCFPSLISLQVDQCKKLAFQLDAHKYKKLQPQGITIQ